jgi:hypothetical protein
MHRATAVPQVTSSIISPSKCLCCDDDWARHNNVIVSAADPYHSPRYEYFLCRRTTGKAKQREDQLTRDNPTCVALVENEVEKIYKRQFSRRRYRRYFELWDFGAAASRVELL